MTDDEKAMLFGLLPVIEKGRFDVNLREMADIVAKHQTVVRYLRNLEQQEQEQTKPELSIVAPQDLKKAKE